MKLGETMAVTAAGVSLFAVGLPAFSQPTDYLVVSKNSGMCLEDFGNGGGGDERRHVVLQTPCSSYDSPYSRESSIWETDAGSIGSEDSTTIKSKSSGLCLGIDAVHGRGIGTVECDVDGPWQQWRIMPAGDATDQDSSSATYYSIEPVNRGAKYSLDVRWGSNADLAPAIYWQHHGGDNQLWMLREPVVAPAH